MSLLYKKTNYLNKSIPYLVNTKIIEYDMHDAGFSLIKEHKLLDEKTIAYINTMSKHQKNIYIGKLMHTEKNLSIDLMKAFEEKRKEFILKNNIQDEDILSIKKDALFLVNKLCKYLTFGEVTFSLKNIYTSYYYINKKEFYFNSTNRNLDIKGLSKQVISYHEDYFLHDLKLFFKLNESNSKSLLFKLYKYREDYLDYKLSTECYRELNRENSYRIKSEYSYDNMPLFIDAKIDKKFLDIGYNYMSYLIPLISYII